MSVICKNTIDGNTYKAFVKGSPEKIFELCRRETIPRDFQQVLTQYTQEGYRVIALSYKEMPENCNYRTVQNMEREVVESDLTFLGMLIMENKMKDVTSDVIKTLQDCEVDTIMATGDNVLTAISVAGQCNIIEKKDQVYLGDLSIDEATQKPFIIWTSQKLENRNYSMQESFNRNDSEAERKLSEAVKPNPNQVPWNYQDENINVALTGKAFRYAFERQQQNPFMFNSILSKAKVYARMSPDDKALLVESLQSNLEINCGMCGDGANDCGALKSAAVGISLSEAEASIAAPFTSKVQDIRCVI